MTRRLRFTLLASGFFVFVTILYLSFGGHGGNGSASYDSLSTGSAASHAGHAGHAGGADAPQGAYGSTFGTAKTPESVLTGGVIAPKLGNETAKKELGRASWRLMHTMMARFPEKPTEDESLALDSYIRLFARLYPCGECATHFQKMLEEYPPQTSSRNAAAGWACFVHNEVNRKLHKPSFDCSKIGDFYDCGCGEEGKDGEGKGKEEKASAKKAKSDAIHDDGESGAAEPAVLGSGEAAIKLEKEEGLSRGG